MLIIYCFRCGGEIEYSSPIFSGHERVRMMAWCLDCVGGVISDSE